MAKRRWRRLGDKELNVVQEHELVLRWVLHGEEGLEARQDGRGEFDAGEVLADVKDIGKNEGQQRAVCHKLQKRRQHFASEESVGELWQYAEKTLEELHSFFFRPTAERFAF